ncbi:MAG: hypothetical protein KGJ86_10780, partial [Chloroflexota bacterium]|nr:hypothetical protein [Chloroflexota bacterium]
LSAMLAFILTTGVHLFMRLGYRHFFRHWLVGEAGMAAGAAIALRTGSHWPALGDMHVIEMSASATALLLLAGAKAGAPAPPPEPPDP